MKLLNLSRCESVCMVTLQEICYSSCSDLSSKPEDRVIIRNKNNKYSCLYSIVVDILSNEKLEMQSEKLHKNRQTLLYFFCFSLRVNPNSLATSSILKIMFAVDISPHFNTLI